MRIINLPKSTFLISEITVVKNVFQHVQIPIYFFLLFITTSLFFPSKLKIINSVRELEGINIKNFTLQNVINQLSPINQRISAYISFLEVKKKEIDINGGIFIACFKDGISVFNYTGILPKFSISGTDKIKIFEDFALDYDTINTTIRIEQKPTFAKHFQITWVLYNHRFILFNTSVKIISLILFTHLIIYFSQKIKISREILIEQRLTLILLILTIGYINPFSIIHSFSSNQFNNLISNLLVNIFYSFFYFYFLSMFTIFIAELKEDYFNILFLLSIPYCYFIISLIILVRNDIRTFQYHSSITVLPEFPKVFNDFSDWSNFTPLHMKILNYFCFISLIYILIIFGLVKKRQKSQKFLYYLSILLFIVFILLFLNRFSHANSHSMHNNALFSCLEYFSILLAVMLCAYGQIEVDV